MKQNSILPPSDWRMSEVWNASLAGGPDRPAQERSRLWASELGKAPIEIFLKMRGVEPTNPPNDRSKRKFSAGRLFEFIVELILNRGGILQKSQEWVEHTYPGLLQVSGKLDFQAGGVPDYTRWEQFEELMSKLGFPDEWHKVSEHLREHFKNNYPSGLLDTILEIKSCSSFMMDSMERTGMASGNHRLQNFHYLKAKKHEYGRIVYICRDDLRMFEVPILLSDEKVEEEYRSLIATYTKFYEDNKKLSVDSFLIKPDSSDVLKWTYNPEGIETLPPLEKPIVWDKDLLKFARNWGVEYSSYLTMLYGYQTQKEFEDTVFPVVTRWNAAMARLHKINVREAWLKERGLTEADIQQDKIEGTRKKGPQYVVVNGEKVQLPDNISGSITLSPGNLEAIEQMKSSGFAPDELAASFQGGSASEEEEN